MLEMKASRFALLLLASACSAAPTRSAVAPTKHEEERKAPPESPLTPATWMLASDFAPAADLGTTPDGVRVTLRRVFALAGGAEGFLESDGRRGIATLAEVRLLDSTPDTVDVRVAKNGKTTFIQTRDAIWIADAFDAPPRKLGEKIGSVGSAWAIVDDKGVSSVDSETGAIEHIAPAAQSAAGLESSTGFVVWRLSRTAAPIDECVVHTVDASWERIAACSVQRRDDGSHAVVTAWREKQPSKCMFVVDEHGKKQPCTTPVGPRERDERLVAALALDDARFFAPGKIVVATPTTGALVAMSAGGSIDASKPLAAALQGCKPLLPTVPLFACAAGAFDVIARVDAKGSVVEELRRPHRDDATSHTTADGGVALGGDCDGTLAESACVRDARGAFHTMKLSRDLVAALDRTAPATRLVPTPDGGLYVGTGAADGFLGGNVHVLLFRADAGPGVTIDKIPTWILASLAGSGGIGSLLAGTSRGPLPSLTWPSNERIRIWPLEREHPAFHTKESCRVDIHLDGTFDTVCLQGRLFSVGRLGLWERRAGELEETRDAGETWTPVPLPRGLATTDIACTAIGCRVGPYWRMGW